MAKIPQALDADGQPLRVGDAVISNDTWSTWRRKVEAVADDDLNERLGRFGNCIRLQGSIAWENARHFVKAPKS